MNDDERARILRMVAEGKVSPEEAADLLEAIQPETVQPESTQTGATQTASRSEPDYVPSMPGVSIHAGNMRPRFGPGRRSRHLVIHIREGGENKVNVRIPLSLTRAAGKFIPRQAQSYLSKYDINLQEFLDEVGDAEGGTLLEVKDGENKVIIAVE